MNYVTTETVEINGVVRKPGEVLDETAFKPASGLMVKNWDAEGKQIADTPEPSELESLLKTGHVKPQE